MSVLFNSSNNEVVITNIPGNFIVGTPVSLVDAGGVVDKISFVVPAGKLWIPQSIHGNITAVGISDDNRTVLAFAEDFFGNIMVDAGVDSLLNGALGETRQYNWALGLNDAYDMPTASTPTTKQGLFNMVLSEGFEFGVKVEGGAGDNIFSSFFAMVREYDV